MMKKMSKFAAIAVTSALLMQSFTGIVYASETEAENVPEDTFFEEASDYEEINYSLNYLGYDSEDTIYCTDYIKAEASAESGMDTRVAVVYTDTEMIGEYVKTYCEAADETRTCFLVENNEEVFEVLTGNESGSIEVSTDGESVELSVDYDCAEQEELEAEEFELREYQVEINTPKLPKYYPTYVSEIEMIIKNTPGAEGYLVKVKNVPNESLSNGIGLCWAACGASIVNYFMGTNYTAKTMYDRVESVISGTPAGTILNMKAMFDVCLLKYSGKAGKLTYSNVSAQHKKGSPVMCCLYGEDRQKNNAEENHVVVLCGSFKISTSYGYVYMDPNEYSRLIINYMDYSQITSSSNDLYYYGGGSIFYLRCNYSFYNFSKGV
ncbi:MAG: hypothetical protein NC223_04840 [Butyrivibrio sp.]|nr:hypothetical protein [Butyrivibrio sp.]